MTEQERTLLEGSGLGRSKTQRPGKALLWFGAGAGALGALVAMAFGELVNGFNTDVPSLVVAVGEVLVDYTPGDLVAASIENVGSSQKPALVAGIIIATLLLGALAGRLAANRSDRIAVGLFATLGLLAGWAAARNPMSPAVGAWITGLVAAAMGAFALYAVLRSAGYGWPSFKSTRRSTSRRANTEEAALPPESQASQSPATEAPPQDDPALQASPVETQAPVKLTSRRGFLAYMGAGISAAALLGIGRQLRASSTTTAAREALVLPSTVNAGSQSLDAQLRALNTLDSVDRISNYITSNENFYRIDTALAVPNVDPANWELSIEGMVDNPYSLTLDDIYAMDLRDYAVSLSCVSNQVGGGLVGNAIWTGVPLVELLDRAGVQRGADQVVGRSVDHWTAGFPTEVVSDGRNAILAIGMNGEPLPVSHGFPARLVVAGLYGYVSAVKWLQRISLTTWDGFDGYWVPRGWSKEGPIKTQSRIDIPQRRDPLVAGTTVPVAGIAWAPTRGIERVEVNVDGGDWYECRMGEALSNETWVQWVYDWTPTSGDHFIEVRATDGDGRVQNATQVPPRPNGAEGWHRTWVSVDDA